MCHDLQKVTFNCGHQTVFWFGKTRYCLFVGDRKDRFHTTFMSYSTHNDICGRCRIAKQLKTEQKPAKGKLTLKGPEFRQLVEKRYHATLDGFEEREGAKFRAQATAALANVKGEQIKTLTVQVQQRIASIMGRNKVHPAAKLDLMKIIVDLPDIFDRGALVSFFASRYWPASDQVRKFARDWERPQLVKVARRAGLERTLQKGLALKTAIPIATLEGGKGNVSAKQPQN